MTKKKKTGYVYKIVMYILAFLGVVIGVLGVGEGHAVAGLTNIFVGALAFLLGYYTKINTEEKVKYIKVKAIRPDAKIPTRGSEEAAGYDLYACVDAGTITIAPHSTVKIHTGLTFELPHGTFGAIVARSGLATKEGLAPANKLGVCDSDYRGEYIVALHNHSDEVRVVKHHERVAQLIIMPYIPVKFDLVAELSETERGNGGFGSTGKN